MDMLARFKTFAHAEDGQDLLEYALLVALIALVCVVSIGLAGTNVNTIFSSIAAKLVTPSS
jgi:Flp pilus assembly pilin Flp